jgi:two-component system chemotaxis response regulator CheY
MDSNMRVLIVDDAPKIRWILRYILKRNGFTNVTEAHNGKSALKVLKKEKIDLILCDWNMPVMSGLELLNKVRFDDELKNVPFIMITAESQKDNIAKAVKAGITDYVMKPFTAKAISEKLQKVFG